MLKVTDIEKLAKDLKLEVNPDIEEDITGSEIYSIYANLLELRDRWEIFDYFYMITNNCKADVTEPEMLKNNRTEEILDYLLENGVITGY